MNLLCEDALEEQYDVFEGEEDEGEAEDAHPGLPDPNRQATAADDGCENGGGRV